VTVQHLFASVPVADRDVALDYYERLFGRSPDLIPNEIEAAWELTESSWIYLIVDPGRAGSGLNTLLVDDLDEFVASAGERGIVAAPVHVVGAGTRQTILVDGDGNRLKVGQQPQAA
jgi:predicted enzyme related to lactoylglutathione lyase